MSNGVISQEQLQKLKGGEVIQGVILCKDYKVLTTRNNKEYIAGTLYSGAEIQFKAWGDSKAFSELKNFNYTDIPVLISGTGDDYGGSISITLGTIGAVEGYTADQFMPDKYAVDAYYNALQEYLKQRLSEKGFALLSKILFNDAELVSRFKMEFAAKSHHDNCKGGLLAHTYKVLTYVGLVLTNHKSLAMGDTNFTDICYIGAVLHDIGKIVEMNFGTYQPCSVVTHTYLGTEIISKYKSDIIEAYDEQWYYTLISVITEHHGVYGEPCKTLPSYIVHMADMMDSRMTGIQQKLEGKETAEGIYVSVDDFKLNWR